MLVKKIINKEYFSSDFYIVNSDKGTIVIDAGFYNNEVKNYLSQLGEIDAILLTHGHFDHIQSLDEIKEDFPKVNVFIHEDEVDLLKEPKYNLSINHGFELKIDTKTQNIKEGKFRVGNYEIQLIHTPGHTSGSCMYYFKDEKILFTGDTLGPTIIGNYFYPTGSKLDMMNSLNKFKQLKIPNDIKCYSSHWGSGTYEEILKMNPYLNI